MSRTDDFGDRMKAYEAAETGRVLDTTKPVYARVDGRAFSKFTRDMRRPFDARMSAAMVGATKHLVKETGARIGFVQSDEISLVWNWETPECEPLFGAKVYKLTSVLASLAAASFQWELRRAFDPETAEALCRRLPHFDARVVSLPTFTEAANAMLWRAMDARKNAVSMAARCEFAPNELHAKDQTTMRAMLAGKGIDFDSAYPASFRLGTWVRRVTVERPVSADEISRIPKAHRPEPGMSIARTEVRAIDMPEFNRVSNRVEVIFDGAAPSLDFGEAAPST